ncbi:MAG: SPOR domain-containing protein [Bacteroidales bacterium]|jgi:hypothetical protein
MIRKFFLLLVIMDFSSGFGRAQTVIKSSELFKSTEGKPNAGHLNIIQDPAIDTLISRYILSNNNLKEKNGYYGMEGFRIQIYRSSVRNARDESNKVKQDFIDKFQNISSYRLYDSPGWYMVRVGDFRTKTEATRLFLMISKVFPNSYLVPDIINFPDPNTK